MQGTVLSSLIDVLTGDREINWKDVVLQLAIMYPEAVTNALLVSGSSGVSAWMTDVRETLRTSTSNCPKVTAIKRCRELTNMGLKDAKDWVESDPVCVQILKQREASDSLNTAYQISPYTANRVRNTVRVEGKVAAIKLLRELTGMGLAEAMDWFKSDPICVSNFQQYINSCNSDGIR